MSKGKGHIPLSALKTELKIFDHRHKLFLGKHIKIWHYKLSLISFIQDYQYIKNILCFSDSV